jgi:hypothetical protein
MIIIEVAQPHRLWPVRTTAIIHHALAGELGEALSHRVLLTIGTL